MKTAALLMVTALSATLASPPALSAAAAGQPVKPAAAPASQGAAPTATSQNANYQEMLKEASDMMGHIGIANIALLHHMTDEANSNIYAALATAHKLEGETSTLNADRIKAGKLKFHSAMGKTRDYWLPLVNDTFVVNSFSSEYLKSKEPKAAEEDAQIVNTKVTLDTKKVREYLDKAASAVTAKQYDDAQAALMSAAQSTFTDETIGNMPLATAYENLGLARNLAKQKDFDGAGFALHHAKDALKEYQKTAGNAQGQKTQKLASDINAMQAEIKRDKSSATAMASSSEKPTLMQSIENSVSTWIHSI